MSAKIKDDFNRAIVTTPKQTYRPSAFFNSDVAEIVDDVMQRARSYRESAIFIEAVIEELRRAIQ